MSANQTQNTSNLVLIAFRFLAVSKVNILAVKCWTAVTMCNFFHLTLGKIYWQLLLLHIVNILKHRNVLLIWVIFVSSVVYL